MRAFIAIFALAVHAANSQFHSVVQSSSWIQGRDGQMHQQVHEVRKDVEQVNGFQKNVVVDLNCIDGNCIEEDTVKYSRGAEIPRAFEWLDRRPHQPPAGLALRGMLRQMLGPRMQVAQPEVVIITDGRQPMQQPHQVTGAPQKPVRSANFLGQVGEQQGVNIYALRLAVMLAGASLMCGILTAIKVLCFSSASAREIRDVAEPLASQGPVVVNAGQVVVKATPELVAETPQPEIKAEEQVFEHKPSVGTWLCHVPIEP